MGFKFNAITGNLDLVGGGSVGIGSPIAGAVGNQVLETDSTGALKESGALTNGQVIIGSTGVAPVVANITGTTSQVTVINGPGTIGLSLPQDIATTSSPTFGSAKLGAGSNQVTVTPGTSASPRVYTVPDAGTTSDFVMTTGTQTITGTKTVSSVLYTDGGIDVNPAGSLSIGNNATTINIGNSGATVNIQGTTLYENVTQLQVTDPLITVNKGGGSGSGSGSGIEIEESSSITGYNKTSGDRNSWTLKAPNTAGIATITPGSSGITLDQSSHNPVTIGTANGLGLVGQVLSASLANTSTTGTLSSTDWNTFNNKQAAGNYITDLSGDVVATGPGAVSATIQAGVIVDSKVSATAGIQLSKLAALSNGKRLLISSTSGVISEAAALTDGQIFIGSTGNAPTAAALTAGSGISISTGSGTITVTNSTKSSGDISETSYTSVTNVPVNEVITGLAFSNAVVRSFVAHISVVINATSNQYAQYTLKGVQRASDWVITTDFTGDDQLLNFSISTAGQVRFSKSTNAGFTSSLFKFRAETTTV